MSNKQENEAKHLHDTINSIESLGEQMQESSVVICFFHKRDFFKILFSFFYQLFTEHANLIMLSLHSMNMGISCHLTGNKFLKL